MRRGFKYRIYPNEEQKIFFEKNFGSSRFIYNKMLEERIKIYEEYKDDKIFLKNYKYKEVSEYKKEFEFLKEVDSLALANASQNIKSAYNSFFKNKSRYPKFKSKKCKKSYTTNNQKGTIKVNKDNVKLPKIGYIKAKIHRDIPNNAKIKSATIIKTNSNKYYISILLEFDIKIKERKLDIKKSLGIDYSSSELIVTTDNIDINYQKNYRKYEKVLGKNQRKLSKMKRGSNNYKKQKIIIAKISEKISNKRIDFLHKLSNMIANIYDIVVIEDLNMKNMSRGLKLGKSTLDNSFGMFRSFLKYKLEVLGKKLIIINKWFASSKICNFCKTKKEDLKLSDRVFICKCGYVNTRDKNAAYNILEEGLRMLNNI